MCVIYLFIYLMNLLSNLHTYYIRYKDKNLTNERQNTRHKLVDTLKRKSTNGTLKVPCEVLPVISLDIVN
jgi:hypothetical protein